MDSVNVSVKLNSTVYGVYVVFNKKTFAQCKSIHFSMLKWALKWETIMGQKQIKGHLE